MLNQIYIIDLTLVWSVEDVRVWNLFKDIALGILLKDFEEFLPFIFLILLSRVSFLSHESW